jgi:hypothetical protein
LLPGHEMNGSAPPYATTCSKALGSINHGLKPLKT